MEEGYLELESPAGSRGPSLAAVSAWVANSPPADRRSPTAPAPEVERRLEELAQKYGLAERRITSAISGAPGRPLTEEESLRAQLDEERLEVERLRAELGSLREGASARQSREGDAQREIEALRTELYAAKARAEQAEARRRAVEEELDEAKKHVAKVRGHVDRREERYLEQDQRLRETEDQLRQLRELSGRMQAECRARVERAEDERLRFESEASVLRTKVREVKRQLKVQAEANRDLQRLWVDLRDIALATGGGGRPGRGGGRPSSRSPARGSGERERERGRGRDGEARAASRRLDESEFSWQTTSA
eukprot:tig00020964_g16777.t1